MFDNQFIYKEGQKVIFQGKRGVITHSLDDCDDCILYCNTKYMCLIPAFRCILEKVIVKEIL